MVAILSAPSNLGLRPPEPGAVPGTCKAPEALREAGLHRRLAAAGARDAGVVLPGRYVDDDATRPPGVVRNQRALVDHARRLAGRIGSVLGGGDTPLVLGGDCSLLVGAGLALVGRSDVGLVHVDGHTDFRHPGNDDRCGSLAGEDLAAAVGRHWPGIADVDGCGPFFEPGRAAHIGCRPDDEHADEAATVLGLVVPARTAVREGQRSTAGRAVEAVGGAGHWLHLDVDVLDPRWMPAVDSPSPGGLTPDDLVELLEELAPTAVGATVTVFDPDLDPGGRHARLLVDLLCRGLRSLGSAYGGR